MENDEVFEDRMKPPQACSYRLGSVRITTGNRNSLPVIQIGPNSSSSSDEVFVEQYFDQDKEEFKKAKSLFVDLDKTDGEKDDRIEVTELVETLYVGDKRRNSDAYRETVKMVQQADQNNNGYLEKAEFYQLMRNLKLSHRNRSEMIITQ